jgi:hypothetical protein
MMGNLGTSKSKLALNGKLKNFLRSRALPALILGGFIVGTPSPSPSTSTLSAIPFNRLAASAQSNEELAFLRVCEAAAEDAKRVRDAANRAAHQEDLDEITDYKYAYSALTVTTTIIHPLLGIVYGGVSLTHLTRMEQEAAAFNESRIRASDEALIHDYESCEIQAKQFTLDVLEIEDAFRANEIAVNNRVNSSYFESLQFQQAPKTTTYAIPFN